MIKIESTVTFSLCAMLAAGAAHADARFEVSQAGSVDLAKPRAHIFAAKAETTPEMRKALSNPDSTVALQIQGLTAAGIPKTEMTSVLVFLHDDKAEDVHSLHFV